MRGVDLDRVGQRQQLVVERVVEHRRHLLGGEARGSGEVGASHVADEEGVAGQHERRLVRRVGVADQRRQALGRVARRLQEAQRDAADAELVAVVAPRGGGARAAALRSEDHLGARALRELAVAAHEVGVQVRLDHVADAKAVRLAPRPRYSSTSRRGSTTTASPSDPIM